MSQSLRIGVAGLGTVGAAVVRMIARRREALQAAGLDITVTAVAARDRSRDRGLDLAGVEWFDDPVALARSGAVDCVVELMAAPRARPRTRSRPRSPPGKPVVTANKALLARHGASLATAAEKAGVALTYEAAVRGHPGHQGAARGARRQQGRARLRDPQRHLQLHPQPDGAGGPDLRSLPEGCAGAGLRRGRPDLRRRGLRQPPTSSPSSRASPSGRRSMPRASRSRASPGSSRLT